MLPQQGGHRWPADIGAAARIGLAGRFLELVEPQSEADPNALDRPGGSVEVRRGGRVTVLAAQDAGWHQQSRVGYRLRGTL